MIRVVVGGQRAGTAHAVGRQHLKEIVNPVRRIDDERLAGGAVSDQVDEVHHLLGHRIANGEIPPSQELAKVEAVVGRV